MWSKVLIIGIIVLLIVSVMAIMKVASVADDTNEKWLAEFNDDKS